MSDKDLKPGWQIWRFEQMAQNVNDRINNPAEADVDYYVGLEHLDTDSLKIRRWGAPSDVEATKLCFRKGDLIFGRRRVYQRKVAVAEFDGICSAHALVLRAKPDVVLPEFLPFFMQSDLFMNRALGISVGSLSPTINWKTLAKQEFALPPLEEQRHVANALTVINANIEQIHLTRTCSTVIVDAILNEKLSQKRKSWKTVSLVNVASSNKNSFVNGPFGSNLLTSDLQSNEGVPVIYIRDIKSGIYERAEDIYVTEEKALALDAASVIPGDLLVAKVGDPPGVAAIYPHGEMNAIITQDVIRLRPDPNKTSSEYLRAYLNSSVGKQHIARISIEGTRRRISLTDFKKMPCILPPLYEQEEIVNYINSIESSQQSILVRLEQLITMRNELLRQL